MKFIPRSTAIEAQRASLVLDSGELSGEPFYVVHMNGSPAAIVDAKIFDALFQSEHANGDAPAPPADRVPRKYTRRAVGKKKAAPAPLLDKPAAYKPTTEKHDPLKVLVLKAIRNAPGRTTAQVFEWIKNGGSSTTQGSVYQAIQVHKKAGLVEGREDERQVAIVWHLTAVGTEALARIES